MTERIIDGALRRIPYYRNDAASLPWYQDLTVCKQVDDRDMPYDAELLHRMYDFLSTHGDCYYIEYQGFWSGMSRRSRCKPKKERKKGGRRLRHGRNAPRNVLRPAGREPT